MGDREAEVYHTVADDLSESVCRFLPDGTFTFVNEVYCRTFGKERRELIGQRWQPVVVEEDLPLVQARLRELSPEQPVVVIENRVIDGAGKTRWMQFTNRGFFDEQGKLKEVQAVGRDITPQVCAELDLDDTRQRWQRALEGSGLGVWDWDIENDEIFFSDEWRRMMGYAPDEPVRGGPMGWNDLVHPDDLPDLQRGVWEHFEGLTPTHSSEFRLRCRNGTWKWVHARGSVMKRDATGRPSRMVGTTADISRRKAVEERERRNLRMVASGAPVSEVLEAIIRSLEATHPGLITSVMLVEEHERKLRLAAAPSLPESLSKAVAVIPLGEAGGCCGRAAAEGFRVICPNIMTAEFMVPFRKVAQRSGLQACWSEPVIGSGGQVIGTFACYLREAREPRRDELAAAMQAANLAAMALEREQRERALALSEERYARALSGTTDGLWDWNVLTGELYLSPRWKEMLGYEEHELQSTREKVRSLLHPDDLPMLEKAREDHFNKREPYEVEYRMRAKDGSYKWFRARGRAEWAEDGRPVRMTGTISDINARKVAELNYQREQAYNQTLLDNAAAFIAVLDEQGCFVHVNRFAQDVLGYAEDEILGRTPWDAGLLETSEVMRSKERFARLLRGESNPPVDVRLRMKDGRWRIVELRSAATRKPDGSPDRIVITGVDLTERHRLQQQVLKIADQEQARLGHDLHDGVGQTMTGLVIMAEALEMELSGEAREQAARILELLRQSVAEVRRMSHGMSPTSVRYRGLVGALQLLAETVQNNFRTPCTAEIDSSVLVTDGEKQTHLFRIAQEAVNNALRHGKPTLITLSLRRLSAREAELRIVDNGKGLPKGKRPADGIGMQVMNYRADLIRASVEVNSRPRRGVTVVCRFPLDESLSDG